MPLVLEKDNMVGGISRTVSFQGYLFDIGGHRFFTKIPAVQQVWHDVLQDEFLLRSRSSRIFYKGKFFSYPLKPLNALLGLGLFDSFRVFLSYVYSHLFPIKNETSFEHWVVNRFGSRLFNIFFKTYTEKVWGIPCGEISAEWAAQRIKGLSLKAALIDALIGKRGAGKNVITTLIDRFHYPARGPGMMWEKVAEELADKGQDVRMNCEVVGVHWDGRRVSGLDAVDSNGDTVTLSADHMISTMPVRELIGSMRPPPPAEVLDAAAKLKYRDFLTVAVIVDQTDVFADNWIYIHEDSVKVGRIQNFKNWSPHMVPDPSKSCLGLEYFCFEGDGLWTMPDDALLELAKTELDALGLVDKSLIEGGAVVRMPKAYPVYDSVYADSLKTIRGFLDEFENLQLVGRNGMHKYNNQDHSMFTAMLAAENVLGADHDLWAVNDEPEYHEEQTKESYGALASTQPRVPDTLTDTSFADEILTKSLARIDKVALAAAMGIVAAALLMVMTIWSVMADEGAGKQMLEPLAQYFYGFSVSYLGAVLGSLHAFVWAFVFGWLLAYCRNLLVGVYVSIVARRANSETMKRVLDYI